MNGKILINSRNGCWVCSEVSYANTWLTRMIGLLSRHTLYDGEGLWLSPCHSIHTIGMKFPIDVIFLDKHNYVRKVVEQLKPYRICISCKGSFSVLELPVGIISKTLLQKGDRLSVL